ncbi:MAG: SRPBCC domain-containing protein [Ilumatobacteraceae bacterium]
MSISEVRKDAATHTMTVTSEWPATVQRVWELWADPRRLERWWGPPMYPATVVEHDLRPGGRVTYFMTGPEGDQHHGYWIVHDVDAPNRFTFTDGFADDEGNTNDALPSTSAVVTLTELPDGRTRMVMTTTFASAQAMEQLIEMGMEEGLQQAMSQIDAILADA